VSNIRNVLVSDEVVFKHQVSKFSALGHGETKLHFDGMIMMMFAFHKTKTLRWIFL